MAIPSTQSFPRKWSIFAWGAAGATAVVLSYVIAVALAIGGLALPFLMFRLYPFNGHGNNTFPCMTSLFGVLMGVGILWSLIPHRISFEAPGIELNLAHETRLAAEIRAVAEALGQPMPAEVYLVPEANAFVAEHSDAHGGRVKYMGLGLTLMQSLTVAEFRSILAHEFAHFYGGDTRLGPWVYHGRAAMVRAYKNLGSNDIIHTLSRVHSIVRLGFSLLLSGLRTYWILFMRITQYISRKQEFRSDELACHVAGSAALSRALKAIHRDASVADTYWNTVVLPVVQVGYQPELADSFARYLAAPHIADATAAYLDVQLASKKSDPFDTHPPLGARIAAADALALQGTHLRSFNDNAPSLSLFRDLPELESALIRKLVPVSRIAALKPMRWETSGDDLFLPLWRKEVAAFAPHLRQTTLAALPELALNPKPIADSIPNPKGRVLNKRQREVQATTVLSKALMLSLVDHGWSLEVQPAVCRLQSGEEQLSTETVLSRMKSKDLQPEEWRAFCNRTGIAEWPLAPSAMAYDSMQPVI